MCFCLPGWLAPFIPGGTGRDEQRAVGIQHEGGGPRIKQINCEGSAASIDRRRWSNKGMPINEMKTTIHPSSWDSNCQSVPKITGREPGSIFRTPLSNFPKKVTFRWRGRPCRTLGCRRMERRGAPEIPHPHPTPPHHLHSSPVG